MHQSLYHPIKRGKLKLLNYYIDESGNTGSNLLDEDQPYFVYGGWIMDDNYKEKIDKYISNLKFKADELHYKKMSIKLAKKANDLSLKIAKDANEFQQLKTPNLVLPFLIVANKKTILCEQLQYAIFDSYYAPDEFKPFIDMLSFNQNFIVILSALIKKKFIHNNSLLIKLNNLFATKDTNLKQDLEDCIQVLKTINIFPENPNSQKKYEQFLNKVNREDILYDLYSKDSKNRKMAYSAELASLTVSALFTEIEKLGKALNDNIYVHADGDTKQYMNNYWKELNKIALNRPDADNNPIIFKYVKHIDTSDSKDLLGIQLADILCGSTNGFLKIKQGMFTKRYKRKNVGSKSQEDFKSSLCKNFQFLYNLATTSDYRLITCFV